MTANGLLRVAADLHTHAIGDGRFDERARDLVARHLEGALEAGLAIIAVTDHDDLRPGLLAEDYAHAQNLPLLIVAGMEVTTNDGHLVALGLREPLQRWQSMTETIAAARQQGALCLLPHPFFPALRERDDVDAMERINFRYGDFDVVRDDIAVVASSDAHTPADLVTNPQRTMLAMRDMTWCSLVDALRQRRVEIVRREHNAQQSA
jgi:predicted metal-dependent phosphoesterase TrpH